ncbi:hypothetical protein N9Q43_00850 [bacterium]|nr:hypothetical protein [bacterium]|tara:strand:+ start:651 stop:857 length:207 start_codon:yes stop_codon:yes gene_type:complete
MKDNFDHYAWNHKRRISEEKEYEVEYWKYTEDGYDNEYITVKAESEEEALAKAKDETRLGKKYKIYKR